MNWILWTVTKSTRSPAIQCEMNHIIDYNSEASNEPNKQRTIGVEKEEEEEKKTVAFIHTRLFSMK